MSEETQENVQEFVSREEYEQGQQSHQQEGEPFHDDSNVSSISEGDIGTYTDEDPANVTSESIRQRYDDIIQQNTELSNQAAENIKLMDIDENSADMVANTIQEIEAACNKKTWTEKATNMLPSPVKKSVNKMRRNTEVNIHKQRSVTDLANRHFEILQGKKENLTENLKHLYQIRDKLEESSLELGKMEQLLIGHIDNVEEQTNVKGKASNAKIEKLQSQEMVIQVQNQYMTQRDLISQISTVEYVAEQVIDSINHTLPTIKSNFIDQVSITAGLKNMKDLKNSVDKTREMVISLQEQSFEDTRNIMTEVQKSGMGYTDEEMDRIEKLYKKKQDFQKQLNQDIENSDRKKDKQIQRLTKMIGSQETFIGIGASKVHSNNDQIANQEQTSEQESQDNTSSDSSE